MNSKPWVGYFFAFLSFALPLGLFYYTHAGSLSFADAGEFALVTKIASVAHGPGTPSYVFFGWLWSLLTTPFVHHHLLRIMIFSMVSVAIACMLMYLATEDLIRRAYPSVQLIYRQLIALVTALSFASGFTAWYWATNVEVYAFHIFTFSLLAYGMITYNGSRSVKDLIIGAVGLGLGLSNHHLTTIFFMPFILLFTGNDMFGPVVTPKAIAKGKKKEKGKSKGNAYWGIFAFFRTRHFWIFTAVSAGVTLFFYGWMMERASVELPFNVSGGAWIKNVEQKVEGIIGLRFPYFMWLYARQYGFFLLLIGAGLIELFRKKRYAFMISAIGFMAFLFAYQIRFNQVGDSDGYMLLPLYFLTYCVPFGCVWLYTWRKQALVILPVFLLIQLIWNFPLDDKRQFDLSESMMKSLDESAPKNSVILVADWALVSEYYYFRIAENFRPDLVVLNYDFKFTNYTIVKNLYPDFYKMIKPEYDNYVAELGREHPQQIYNTGCDLTTPALQQSFVDLYKKISKVCTEKGWALLYDPKSFVYFTQNKIAPPNFYVSGCFVSSVPTGMGKNFISLPYKWLDVPFVKYEPSAGDKLVDLQAMLDFHSRYYEATHDTADLIKVQQSHDKIMRLQAEMKENIPFMFLAPQPK
jgi:uncharacterized short protein YbdD (DUF466 family)